MSDNKLKIRIQIQQPQQTIEQIYPNLPEPGIVYEESLDWGKISIAVLFLLSALALISYLLFGIDQHATPETAPPATDQTVFASENKIPVAKTTSESGAKNNAIKNHSGESLSEYNEFPEIMQSKDSAQSSDTLHPDRRITIPITEPEPAVIVNKPTIIPHRKPKAMPQAKPREVADHSQVLRAQLSHDIKAREPVDDINTIQLREGESKPIYFYLHLKDLQEKKVSILWYHDNRLDSQLPLEIHDDNWRTNASKQLDQQRLGAWRVELVGETGHRLATRNFTVTKY